MYFIVIFKVLLKYYYIAVDVLSLGWLFCLVVKYKTQQWIYEFVLFIKSQEYYTTFPLLVGFLYVLLK